MSYEVIMGKNGLNIPGPITDEAVREVLGDTVDSEGTSSFHFYRYYLFISLDLDTTEALHTRRITRIITNDFPRFFALITRIRQEVRFLLMNKVVY